MVSKKTRKRVEGALDAAEGIASLHPVGDKLLKVKKVGEGAYKMYTGRNPPSVGDWFDKEEKRRERAFDRRIERIGRPRGVDAAERGR